MADAHNPNVEAVNIFRRCVVLSNGYEAPITDWFDTDGEPCAPNHAVACVAGSDNCWFAIDLTKYSAGTVH